MHCKIGRIGSTLQTSRWDSPFHSGFSKPIRPCKKSRKQSKLKKTLQVYFYMTTNIQKHIVTKEQAFQKIKYYCSYQERCHAEVKEKLYSFGLWKKDVETLISRLIEENYLNEERFAQLFVSGKFRLKQWGRVKIKHELKQKHLSEYCINKGLKEIDEDEYKTTLRKLAAVKWETLKTEKSIFTRKKKTLHYLLQKGYEAAIANEAIAGMQEKK